MGSKVSFVIFGGLSGYGLKLSVEDTHISRWVDVEPVMPERRGAEMAEKMRKRSRRDE